MNLLIKAGLSKIRLFDWLTGSEEEKLQYTIENTLTQQVRYLDELVDELVRGRKMEKILRAE